MSEEIAWAVADIALQQRLVKRARRWKRCATRVWARLRAVETQRAQLEAQLAGQRVLVERLVVYRAVTLPELLTPLQRACWAEVMAALDQVEAPGVGVGGGGGEQAEV